MEIKVKSEFTNMERHVVLKVSGTEPLFAPYSLNGATFQPGQVNLCWRSGTYQQWRLSEVKVSGGLIKKDGTVSKAAFRERVWYGNVEQAPKWVQEIVAKYAPEEEK